MSYEYGTLEYAIDAHLRKHDDATRPKRVAEVCALVNAKLGPAEIAPEPTSEELLGPKPYDGPGEDAGEVLVGVLCYLWDGIAWESNAGRFVVNLVKAVCGSRYRDQSGTPWDHARPLALGLPERRKA